ncbi:MAG TPA: hypothetical protein VGO36_05135 [Solirubrobacterales bacterium]|nr:hypothetical protein [Solirubrobacterales bacterium]
MTGSNGEASGRDEAASSDGEFPLVLAGLETAVLSACAEETEWPAQIAAGIYAGVDFAIENPIVVRALTVDAAADAGSTRRYERVIGRLAGFIQIKAPVGTRLPGSTDEALVASVVGLVGDHIRIGRLDRLEELRPELVLLTLLPYLGFAEAQEWSNRIAESRAEDP